MRSRLRFVPTSTYVDFPRVRRIMGAYVDGKPFSVEFVAAVGRLVVLHIWIAHGWTGYETINVHR